jgi:4-hydroxy-tetrahydrodipicolinate synthase
MFSGVWLPIITPFVKEPNPVPIKHCLWRQGLIASAGCRLPLTRVSETLAGELDRLVPAGVAG